MNLFLWLALPLAWGEDVPVYDGSVPLWGYEERPAGPEEPPLERDAEGVHEITVYGEVALRERREAVGERMEELGWTVRDRGDQVVFLPPRSWMPRISLTREGLLLMNPRLASVDNVRYTDRSREVTRADLPAADRLHGRFIGTERGPPTMGVGPQVMIVGPRITSRVFGDVLEAIRPELEAYRATLWRTAHEERLAILPNQLDTLWEEGRPLEGSGWLDTPEARRQAVLSYWSDRADTPEGHAIADVVEQWLGSVVQRSAHPVTAREVAEAHRARADDRTLDLPGLEAP